MDTIVTPVTVITLDSTRIEHSIKADLVARYFPPVVRLVQYDQSLPVIAVSLMQNGQTYTLPSGAAANIRVHKPDSTYVYNPALGCDSTRKIVYFEVTQAMAAANGDGLAIVEIVVDGDIAGTSLITLHFEENPVPEDAIESSDEWETIYELGERIIASTVTPVSTAAGMTDHNVVYLYTGTESGWNQGHMYYYNGTTWVDAGIAVTDTTLSVAGLAADAKKTGDEIADLKDGLSQDNTYAATMTANSKWPYASLGTVTQGITYSFRYNDLQVSSDAGAGEVYLWGETSAQRIINNIPLGETVTFTAAQTESVRVIVYLANGQTHRPKISYEFWVTETGRSLSAVVDGLTAVESDVADVKSELNQGINRPFITKSDSSSNAKTNAGSILCMWFEFADEATEKAFWDGSHTYNTITTTSRNICLAYIPSATDLRFYWLGDNGSFITGDIAFTIVQSEYHYIVDVYSYHEKTITLDGYSIKLHAFINWYTVAGSSTEMYSIPFAKTFNRYYGNLFKLNTEYKVFRPIKRSHDSNKTAGDKVIKAIHGFMLSFATLADETAFWSGSHTYGGSSYSRNVGPCVYAISNNVKQLTFYWMTDANRFIAGNSAFQLFENQNIIFKIDSITFHRKEVTLDGYTCFVFAAIEWGVIDENSTYAFHLFYDKNSIQYEKDLFAFSGILGANSHNTINFGVDGDSITAGNQWSYYVYNKLGYRTHHNVGVGSSQWQDEIVTYNGTTYYPQIYGQDGWLGMSDGWETITSAEEAQKRANNSSKNHVLKFIDEVDHGTYPEPDIFVFALGTNDDPTRLGTVDAAFASSSLPSVTDELLRTTTGAMRWCIQKLHTEYPKCKIFWSTPIQSANDTRQNANITKIPVMTEVANRLSAKIIDQWNDSGISAIMEKASAYYLRDGVHPNANGVEAMGRLAVAELTNY